MKTYLRESIITAFIFGTICHLVYSHFDLPTTWLRCVLSAFAGGFGYHLWKGNVQISDFFTPWMLRLGTPKEWFVTAFAVALVFALMILALIAL